MNAKFAIISILLMILLAGCGVVLPSVPAASTTPPQAVVTQIVVSTPVPTNTPTKVPSTATSAPTVASANTNGGSRPCSLKDSGKQLLVDKRNNGDWIWDPASLSADMQGCQILAEGRQVLNEEHHIWLLGADSAHSRYLASDGKFHAKEMSVWTYPQTWNMGDFSTTKPPIAAEFVNAKRVNQQANRYDWPMFVHLLDGNVAKFEKGVLVRDVKLPNNCSFSEPQKLSVAGIYDPTTGSFDASIGGDNCWTVARVDGQVLRWKGAKDNVMYKSVTAYLIPSSWTQSQIDQWQPPSQ